MPGCGAQPLWRRQLPDQAAPRSGASPALPHQLPKPTDAICIASHLHVSAPAGMVQVAAQHVAVGAGHTVKRLCTAWEAWGLQFWQSSGAPCGLHSTCSLPTNPRPGGSICCWASPYHDTAISAGGGGRENSGTVGGAPLCDSDKDGALAGTAQQAWQQSRRDTRRAAPLLGARLQPAAAC